jgi:uncharacterized protein involved in exopolysaccharide biosynthesis
MTGEIGQVQSQDALSENMTIQTQARILQSDTVALKVIQELKLEDSQDFPRPSPVVEFSKKLFAGSKTVTRSDIQHMGQPSWFACFFPRVILRQSCAG